jgi:4-hydroxybenzoate polyprenyltransferase/phosphoserine phosphatase
MSSPDTPGREALAVDLDGTLLRTDTMYECIAALLRKPWSLLAAVIALTAGRAAMKAALARRASIETATLPVNDALLEWIAVERTNGRRIGLFSAANDAIVKKVAERFGVFTDAQGSDERVNLRGMNKYAAIEARYGATFTYAGDHRRDLPVWRRCRRAILVGDVERLRRALPDGVHVEREFAAAAVTLRTWVHTLRLHQWTKNLLVFVPLLLGGAFEAHYFASTALAFLAFGLAASANYVLNDLMDLASDRMHPVKRHRPFASGMLSIRAGFLGIPVLAALAILATAPLSLRFAAVLGVYIGVTALYSTHLKREPVLDLLTLAFLFSMRLVAGMVVTDAPLSPWLLAFSMFFFFSVAAVKRYDEIRLVRTHGRAEVAGRGYQAADDVLVLALGVSSGFCSSLVFFIYLVDAASPAHRLPHPELLSAICIILSYWLGRLWLKAVRGLMHVDPVAFALRDRVSLFLGLLTMVLVIGASWR